MAENTVVKEQLTDEMIEAGAQLTQKLDELGLPISVAMWFFLSDVNEWRLLFASPQLSAEGPRAVYEKIEEARKALGTQADRLPLSAIGLMDANHQLVQLLRNALQTPPGVSRVRFSKNVIDGHFIEDALIYRSAA
jgi:antitoxin component of RelBE/YafQ-DinJ toxin-antitoxin module